MMTTASTATTADPLATTATFRLYLARAVVALAWAGLLIAALSAHRSLSPRESVPALAAVLLVGYPLIDVVASLVDARTRRRSAPGNAAAQWGNGAVSAVAAVAIAVSASHGADAILRVFGVWATLTGLVQLALAVLRRRQGTPGQWPMMLSGAISTVVGFSFLHAATESELHLSTLAGYATLGAVFYLVSAWHLRARRESAPALA